MPRLAIQIILYKSSPHLAPLLDSLKAQTYRDFEVFFLDNSEDSIESEHTRALVATYDTHATFKVTRSNVGFAGGHVQMYEMHSIPFVMLLNDDAKLGPDYLKCAMERIESDEKIASVTGLVYRMDDHRTVDTSGLEYRCMAHIVDRQHAPESAGKVFGVSGAVGLYRCSAIEKAGGLFDPTWFMYKEDVDLAIRLRRAGFVAWYEPCAIAWHKRGIKKGDKMRKRPALLREHAYRNQHHIYTLHAAASLGFKDFFCSLLFELARTFVMIITSPIVWFRAVISLAQSFPRFWRRRSELEKLGLPHRRMLV